MWNDEAFYAWGPGNYSVIEWSADCNNDGIVDYGQCRDGTLPDYNGNNIPDCCEAGLPCVVGSYPVQWRTADGGNGHWYRLVNNGSHHCWSTASAQAEAVGGHLVSEVSQAEHDFVCARFVSQDSAWKGRWGPWIGGHLSGGVWTWTTGEPWTFTAWQAGEPNGGGSETVVSYIAQGEGGGCGRTTLWNDFVDCGNPTTTGCDMGVWTSIEEWSADCNNDGIVDKGQILRGQLQDANSDGVPDICQQLTCRDADLFPDGRVGGDDLGVLLVYWGPVTSSAFSRRADFNRDGFVNGDDLGFLLTQWGPCPN